MKKIAMIALLTTTACNAPGTSQKAVDDEATKVSNIIELILKGAPEAHLENVPLTDNEEGSVKTHLENMLQAVQGQNPTVREADVLLMNPTDRQYAVETEQNGCKDTWYVTVSCEQTFHQDCEMEKFRSAMSEPDYVCTRTLESTNCAVTDVSEGPTRVCQPAISHMERRGR